MNLQQRVAVKALIVNDQGLVLVLRKSNDDKRHAGKSGRNNLPGGKLALGETIDDGLRREVREETGLELGETPPAPIFVGEWRPVVAGVPHQIIGMFFVCERWRGTTAMNSEHDQAMWVAPERIDEYDLLPPEGDAVKAYLKARR